MRREDARGRGGGTGPRHAAPKKPLLTRVQLPGGRTIALAAMPSALLVGLGLAPGPAQAEDPAIPFAPGPCVSQPDEAEEEETTAEKDETAGQADQGRSEDQPQDEDDAGRPGDAGEPPAPGKSTGPGARPPDGDGEAPEPKEPEPKEPEPERPDGGGSQPDAPAAPAPEPPAGKERDPWDPLGIGAALEDLFDGPFDGPDEPEPAREARAPSAEPSAGDGADKPQEPTARNPVEGAVEDTKQAMRDAAARAGAKVEELADEVQSPAAATAEDAPGEAHDAEDAAPGDAAGTENAAEAAQPPATPDGKTPYPCPTRDPEALANAELEPGLPLLADEPWRLEATRLTLTGLDYHGIVDVQTASGTVKKALKFTSDKLDIKDLHQIVPEPGGPATHVTGAPGSTSTITGGTTLYTEELKGNLFGLIPITFSPDTPPPLNVPFAFFTDVTVIQAAQFGGTLTIPGMRLSHDPR